MLLCRVSKFAIKKHSFWIPPEGTPARVTLGVTSLLTLTTQVEEQLESNFLDSLAPEHADPADPPPRLLHQGHRCLACHLRCLCLSQALLMDLENYLYNAQIIEIRQQRQLQTRRTQTKNEKTFAISRQLHLKEDDMFVQPHGVCRHQCHA